MSWKFVEENFRYKYKFKYILSFVVFVSIINSLLYIYGNEDGYIARYSEFPEDVLTELIYGENQEYSIKMGNPALI